jgi:hypothetical protein
VCGLYSTDSGYRPVAGSFEHNNESSSSMKCWEFLEKLTVAELLKKDSVP